MRTWILLFLIACGGGSNQKPKAPEVVRVEAKPPAPAPAPPPPAPAKPCVTNEECATRCEADDAPSCTAIAKRHLHGENGLAESADDAKPLFERACAKRDPEGCYHLALDWGDDASRVANYTTACDGGWAFACTNLGARYAGGRGVAADPVRARALAEKACTGGDTMACSNLGMYLLEGTGGAKDLARSRDLSRQACDANDGSACARLAEMYDEGNGVEKDQETARKIYIRACDLGEGCNNLGVMYDRGEGGGIDIEAAKTAFEKACDKADQMGCVNRGRFWRDGRDGTTDRGEAARLFDLACKAGEKDGCDSLPGVVQQLKDACKRKAGDCTNWGFLNERGIGVPVSGTAALKLYQRACTGKSAVGCENVGTMYRDGIADLKVDPKRALQYYDRACKLDRDSACRKAKDLRARP